MCAYCELKSVGSIPIEFISTFLYYRKKLEKKKKMDGRQSQLVSFKVTPHRKEKSKYHMICFTTTQVPRGLIQS